RVDSGGIEIVGDLQLVGGDVEVGNGVVAGVVLVENVNVGLGTTLHEVVADVVDERVVAGAAEQIVIAGARLQRGVCGAAEQQVNCAGAAHQGVVSSTGVKQRIAAFGRQRGVGRGRVDLDLAGLQNDAVRQARIDVKSRLSMELRPAGEQPAIGLHRVGR